MKQFGRQLHTQAKTVKLRSVERAELKERLQMYMEYHPLPNTQTDTPKTTASAARTQSTLAGTVQKWFMPFAGVTAVFLVFMLPVVAEQAVPGDLLYPMKVQVNEELRSTLTFSSQDKIEWETARIGRRLAEARLLESQGRLTDELEQAVAQAVRTHAQNTEAEIAALREINADEAALAEVSFASSLAVQSEVLSQTISEREPNEAASPVLLAVQSEEQQANERSANSAPSYERMLALIESETTTATELFNSIRGSIPEEDIARIERRFADLQGKIQNTIAAHEDTDTSMSAEVRVATTSLPSKEESEAVATSASTSLPDTASETAVSAVAATSGTSTPAVERIEAPEASATATDNDRAEETLRNSQKDTDAVIELRGVLQDVKRIIRFMSDITVRESVSIDDWVPVALTSEERVTDLEALLAELKRIQELTDVEQLSSEATADIEGRQRELVRNIFTIEELVATDDIESAERVVTGAYQEAQALQELVRDYAGGDSRSSTTATTTPPTTDTELESDGEDDVEQG